MNNIIVLSLSTVIAASIAVMLFRRLSGWRVFSHVLVGRTRKTLGNSLPAQKGYIGTRAGRGGSKGGKGARQARKTGGAIIKPWGW